MKISDLIIAAVEYDKGDPRRIQHFMKVWGFAKTIGEEERLPPEQLEILEAAAVLHDIGIHECERKYGSCAGEYQQAEGVPVAQEILSGLGAEEKFSQRVCFLIAHHHTYADIDAVDWQILVEADFLVNAYEDKLSPEAIRAAGRKNFRTETGTRLLNLLFLA